MSVADWAQLGVGLGVGAAFLAYIIPRLVKYLDEKNTQHAQEIKLLNEAHKQEIKGLTEDYERRLDKKDATLNKVVEQTYNAVSDMSEAIEKTTEMLTSMREEFEPLKKAQPLIIDMAEKINKLAQAQ